MATRYDVLGGRVRVLTALRDAIGPLEGATGTIVGLDGVTDTAVRLACAGLDATLEPVIEGRTVTYLANPPPFEGPPALPEDPCAPSPPPTVVPGDPPAPPDTPPPPEGGGPEDDPAPEGEGEEEPEGEEEAAALRGEWVVDMGWKGFDEWEQPLLEATHVTAYTLEATGGRYGGLPIRATVQLDLQEDEEAGPEPVSPDTAYPGYDPTLPVGQQTKAFKYKSKPPPNPPWYTITEITYFCRNTSLDVFFEDTGLSPLEPGETWNWVTMSPCSDATLVPCACNHPPGAHGEPQDGE